MQIITFKNTYLHVKEDTTHEFLLSNTEVALGYGITAPTLRSHQSKNKDEFIEGKHWIRLHVKTAGGMQNVIHWTKKGIVRLGFFIKSKQAKAFRDWAEDYIINPHNYISPQAIAGYKSQLTRKNNEIQNLKRRLGDLPALTLMSCQDRLDICEKMLKEKAVFIPGTLEDLYLTELGRNYYKQNKAIVHENMNLRKEVRKLRKFKRDIQRVSY